MFNKKNYVVGVADHNTSNSLLLVKNGSVSTVCNACFGMFCHFVYKFKCIQKETSKAAIQISDCILFGRMMFGIAFD